MAVVAPSLVVAVAGVLVLFVTRMEVTVGLEEKVHIILHNRLLHQDILRQVVEDITTNTFIEEVVPILEEVFVMVAVVPVL